MNKKERLICCIVAVIISLCLLITVIYYIASTTNSRPRTPDGTKPTKAPPKKSTVETWKNKKVWVDTLPTKPATIVTADPNATLTVTSTTTTITPWFVSTTSVTTTSTTTTTTTTLAVNTTTTMYRISTMTYTQSTTREPSTTNNPYTLLWDSCIYDYIYALEGGKWRLRDNDPTWGEVGTVLRNHFEDPMFPPLLGMRYERVQFGVWGGGNNVWQWGVPGYTFYGPHPKPHVKASKTFSWGQRPSYHQMWRMFDEYVFSYDSANSIDNYRDQSNRDWPFVSPIIHLADKPAYSYLKYVYVFDGFCTPFLNNQLCGWDGGDCCYPYVDTHQRCGLGEDCTCHWTGLRHPTYKDEYGCRPQGASRYMGDGICNDLLNVKECLYDLGDCCLKFPALNTDHEYWYGPNIKCVEDSPGFFESNIRVLGPLEPTKKFYDKINAHANQPTKVGMDCYLEHFTGMLRHWDRVFALGDGTCDDALNTPGCLYDFGDCCMPYLIGTNNHLRKSNGFCHMTGMHTPVGYWVESPYCFSEKHSAQHTSECSRWAKNRQVCNWSNGNCCFPYIKDFFLSNHDEYWVTNAAKCHFDWIYRNYTHIQQNNRFKWNEQPKKGTFEYGFMLSGNEAKNRMYWTHSGQGLATRLWTNTTERDRVVEPKDVLRAHDVNHCEEEKVGNNHCDGLNNHYGCFWDGGDCCLPLAEDFANCSQGGHPNVRQCFCHSEGQRHWEADFWQCEANWETLGDGICDDGPPEIYNVTAKCLGDFGDCCLPVIDTSRCVECICLNDNTTHATSFGQYLNGLTQGSDLALELHRQAELQSEYSQIGGDPIGYLYGEEKSCRHLQVSNHCYDSQNQPACNYNFGDCCRPYVDRTHCAECICWEDGTVHPGQVFVDNADDAFYGQCTGLWIGDGACDTFCNKEEFLYDGGDCCLPLTEMSVSWPKAVENIPKSFGDQMLGPRQCMMSLQTTPTTYHFGCDLLHEDRHNYVAFRQWNLYIVQANGVCEDWNNKELCNYDAGACCGLMNGRNCYWCLCHSEWPRLPPDVNHINAMGAHGAGSSRITVGSINGMNSGDKDWSQWKRRYGGGKWTPISMKWLNMPGCC